jgi:hypothetical protein
MITTLQIYAIFITYLFSFVENDPPSILPQLSEQSRLLIESNRKTVFFGFIINCNNLLNLYKDLKSHYKFEYILSFKLSQDHLETFFSAVRSRSGFNNNPSCLQFKATYKRLIVKHEISGSK